MSKDAATELCEIAVPDERLTILAYARFCGIPDVYDLEALADQAPQSMVEDLGCATAAPLFEASF